MNQFSHFLNLPYLTLHPNPKLYPTLTFTLPYPILPRSSPVTIHSITGAGGIGFDVSDFLTHIHDDGSPHHIMV